jgi:secondary thiamine-phosphate synthase enzyme
MVEVSPTHRFRQEAKLRTDSFETMLAFQVKVVLPSFSRGCHLITDLLLSQLPELERIHIGTLDCFLQHTSASLTINENADPDVRRDMEMGLNYVAPEELPYIHTIEGPDDMPAHTKSSLIGCNVTIPISGGRLALGVWQGIYLCEHRNHASSRTVVLTAMGISHSHK